MNEKLQIVLVSSLSIFALLFLGWMAATGLFNQSTFKEILTDPMITKKEAIDDRPSAVDYHAGIHESREAIKDRSKHDNISSSKTRNRKPNKPYSASDSRRQVEYATVGTGLTTVSDGTKVLTKREAAKLMHSNLIRSQVDSLRSAVRKNNDRMVEALVKSLIKKGKSIVPSLEEFIQDESDSGVRSYLQQALEKIES